jgi:hypothetical protein
MRSISVRISIVASIMWTLLIPAVLADGGPSFKFVSAEVGLSPRSVVGPPTLRLLLEGTPGGLAAKEREHSTA